MPRGGDHSSKSAALKKLEGDRRKIGRRALEAKLKREPKGRGRPAVPAHLTAAEQREFQHVLDTAPSVLLTGADQRMIEAYAVAVTTAEDARAQLAATGRVIEDVDRSIVNPYWRIWRQAANDAR